MGAGRARGSRVGGDGLSADQRKPAPTSQDGHDDPASFLDPALLITLSEAERTNEPVTGKTQCNATRSSLCDPHPQPREAETSAAVRRSESEGRRGSSAAGDSCGGRNGGDRVGLEGAGTARQSEAA